MPKTIYSPMYHPDRMIDCSLAKLIGEISEGPIHRLFDIEVPDGDAHESVATAAMETLKRRIVPSGITIKWVIDSIVSFREGKAADVWVTIEEDK
ncbi:MAG: hypothetical protein PHH01_01150 [Patescibacteria group bacterium]|nr:hypothetical protein [Patescibacteria group bacterium]